MQKSHNRILIHIWSSLLGWRVCPSLMCCSGRTWLHKVKIEVMVELWESFNLFCIHHAPPVQSTPASRLPSQYRHRWFLGEQMQIMMSPLISTPSPASCQRVCLVCVCVMDLAWNSVASTLSTRADAVSTQNCGLLSGILDLLQGNPQFLNLNQFVTRFFESDMLCSQAGTRWKQYLYQLSTTWPQSTNTP